MRHCREEDEGHFDSVNLRDLERRWEEEGDINDYGSDHDEEEVDARAKNKTWRQQKGMAKKKKSQLSNEDNDNSESEAMFQEDSDDNDTKFQKKNVGAKKHAAVFDDED